jgi:hypothetical protein
VRGLGVRVVNDERFYADGRIDKGAHIEGV